MASTTITVPTPPKKTFSFTSDLFWPKKRHFAGGSGDGELERALYVHGCIMVFHSCGTVAVLCGSHGEITKRMPLCINVFHQLEKHGYRQVLFCQTRKKYEHFCTRAMRVPAEKYEDGGD